MYQRQIKKILIIYLSLYNNIYFFIIVNRKICLHYITLHYIIIYIQFLTSPKKKLSIVIYLFIIWTQYRNIYVYFFHTFRIFNNFY